MTMVNSGKKEAVALLLGDLLLFVFSLWLTLSLRYNELPDRDVFVSHLEPFSLLFVFWLLVFFISGLYDKHTNAFKQKLPAVILNAQLTNSIIAALFFYFIPYYKITPRINLFIYLLVTIVLTSAWRILFVDRIYLRRTENVLLIGDTPEVIEIENELKVNKKYGLTVFRRAETFSETDTADIPKKVFTIILDLDQWTNLVRTDELLGMIFSGVRFLDVNNLYEDMFDKVSLSGLSGVWFLKNVSNYQKFLSDILKRTMDVIISSITGLFSLLLLPLVYLAIKIDDGGPVIIEQERIGKGNKMIHLFKFRTMNTDDRGVWSKQGEDKRVTRVGRFLRSSRIDELPQLWNVFAGDISLIGPRPDMVNLGIELSKEIPFYLMRYTIKPGLSGWAQIHQDLPPRSVGESRERLAYDFYYLKNRSFFLDIQIALRTIKTLLMRAGL